MLDEDKYEPVKHYFTSISVRGINSVIFVFNVVTLIRGNRELKIGENYTGNCSRMT